MKTVKLNKIEIVNFKGIDNLEIDLGGENARVFGANGTGKTSIADAYLFCLSGKDSLSQADFEIKPLNGNGDAAHNLDHAVNLEFDIDGKTRSYSRIYKEKWSKKRGKARAEFTGHTTDYLIDGVPVKMKEFDQDVADNLADPGLLWILTCPMYFSSALDWKRRREILFTLCGNVSETAIIADEPSLKDLKDVITDDQSIDNVRSKITANRKAVNNELDHIPARIDELSKQVVVIDPVDATFVDQIKQENADLADKIVRLESSDNKRHLENELEGLQIELRQARMAIANQTSAVNEQYRDKIRKVEDDVHKTNQECGKVRANLEQAQNHINREQATLERLRSEYAKLVERPIQVDNICPTCRQMLPKVRVTEAVKKLQQDKDAAIEANKQAGMAAKNAFEKWSSEIQSLEYQEVELRQRLDSLYEKQAKLKNEMEKSLPAESNEETLRLIEKITELKVAIKNIDSETQNNANRLALAAKIEENQARLDEIAGQQATIKSNEKIKARIAELEAREKELGAEFERLERLLFLIEDLIRKKISKIEDTVNQRFSIVNWKLFSDQINGGLKECCEATVNGVPYGSVNSAGRVHAGIDIINTLQAAYQIVLPIIIDGRESVTTIPATQSQVLSLIVSDKHQSIEIKKGA